MKTGIMLYPRFSEYELSVLLSVLTQSNKQKQFIGLTDQPVIGESGLTVMPETTLNNVDVKDIDSLVLPGVDDFSHLVAEQPLFSFVKEASQNGALIGAISSAPFILANAGLLKDKKYTVGFSKEQRDFIGSFPEKNFVEAPVVADGNIITAVGSYFVPFARKFGQKLGLKFDPLWYG